MVNPDKTTPWGSPEQTIQAAFIVYVDAGVEEQRMSRGHDVNRWQGRKNFTAFMDKTRLLVRRAAEIDPTIL